MASSPRQFREPNVAKEAGAELIRYRSIGAWQPSVGDIVIKHGWVTRTKWFGVINFIDPTGVLYIIKGGMMGLLVSMGPDEQNKNTIRLSLGQIANAPSMSYVVVKQEQGSPAPVWYV